MPTLADLSARLGGTITGDGNINIHAVRSLKNAGSGHLAFYEQSKSNLAALKSSKASAVLLTQKDTADCPLPCWVVSHPRLHFAKVTQILHKVQSLPAGISPLASVSAQAQIHDSATIAPFAVIQAGATIAAGVFIGEHTVIKEGVTINENSTVLAGAVLYPNVIIGKWCTIHSGAILGADGFNFVSNDSGQQIKTQHVGILRIGDDVEIGANSTIDRGTLDETVIGNGVKIDNQVQIGHNIQIGDNTVICGCTGISGSTVIGKNCIIGGATCIAGHITIGDNVKICGSSVVTKSIGAGEIISSVMPTMPIKRWRRFVATLRRLEKH